MKARGYIEAALLIILYKLYENDTWVQWVILVAIILALGTFFDWIDLTIEN